MNNTFEHILVFFAKVVFCCFAVCVVFFIAYDHFLQSQSGQSSTAIYVDDGVCNLVIVPISGTIGLAVTGAEVNENGELISKVPTTGDVDRVIRDLELIKANPRIVGVIFQIDSYGGVGNAANVLLKYLENYPLPIVSLIRDAGTSMAYWVALGGQTIIAYDGSDVGSIGVDTSFISTVQQDKKEGLEYVQVTSGKYKDSGNPSKEITEDDMEYFRDINNKFAELFIKTVSEKRNLSLEKVKGLATGRVWTAQEGKELGLIDQVGGLGDAISWFEKSVQNKSESLNTMIPCAMY